MICWYDWFRAGLRFPGSPVIVKVVALLVPDWAIFTRFSRTIPPAVAQ
jgi:hypothetical protein